MLSSFCQPHSQPVTSFMSFLVVALVKSTWLKHCFSFEHNCTPRCSFAQEHITLALFFVLRVSSLRLGLIVLDQHIKKHVHFASGCAN